MEDIVSTKKKTSRCVSCSECGFADVCQAYLFDRQEPLFIHDLARGKRISKNAFIYQSGTPVTALYALRSGVAKIYDTQQILQGILLPGQIFGAEELFTSQHQYSVQAATDVEICELQKTHFYEISQLTSTFTHFIIRILSRSAREKQLFINVLVKSDGLQKVSDFIQLIADIRKEYGFEHRAIELPLTKKELAQLLGISQSTLARALAALVEQQRVLMNKKEITLLHH
ncbi:TPA: Crp/Fnr family transcriptional regulator [Enterobacter ludwigii]|jgi:CRP/FNR family transcriptional regulator|nr:Crp/Fnr family transcriptional regulator [Enterobacter ludwigii]EKS7205794.1 Crp/Fnr family transcriptional regulator [Enterobacter ludwigii]ELK6196652.1 Crp/Fnr family transcriptional regulator [Enterobacter ludwigii]ELK6199522.1 Crp/Fnr family transcriptional regulator [Enterobacter ludwigii]ELP5692825.1 Crp/Fnr family transcriptional regulator [Enterobacter ludwigii]